MTFTGLGTDYRANTKIEVDIGGLHSQVCEMGALDYCLGAVNDTREFNNALHLSICFDRCAKIIREYRSSH